MQLIACEMQGSGAEDEEEFAFHWLIPQIQMSSILRHVPMLGRVLMLLIPVTLQSVTGPTRTTRRSCFQTH